MINGVYSRRKMANLHACESHRDESRTKEKEAEEEDRKRVGGSPGGSDVETRQRRMSAGNDSSMRRAEGRQRGEQTHNDL